MTKNLVYFFRATFLVALSINFSSINGRSFFTPLPYAREYFYADLANPKILFNDINNNFFFSSQLLFYNRKAFQSFDSSNGSIKHDLSYLFHGSDEFKISDLFYNAEAPESEYKKFIDPILAFPEYTLSESGCILNFYSQINTSLCNNNIRFHIKAGIPIKNLEIANPEGYNSLEVDLSGIPSFLQDQWIRLDNANKTFAARIDYLQDNGVIEPWSVDPINYFVINSKSFKLDTSDTSSSGISSLPLSITLGSILNNTGGSRDATNFKLLKPYISDTNETIKLDKDRDKAIPLNFYAKDMNRGINVVDTDLTLVTKPKQISSNNLVTADKIYYASIDNGKKIGEIRKDGSSPVIIGAPSSASASIGSNSENVEVDFEVPPVFVFKSFNLPESLSYQKSLAKHSPDGNSGKYATYESQNNIQFAKAEDFDLKIMKKISLKDNEFKNLEELGEGEEPSIFWYTEDYVKFLNSGNTSDYYIVSSLDQNGRPTEVSSAIYKKLVVLEQDAINETAADSLSFTSELVKGKYVEGISPKAKLTKKTVINWTNYKKQGLGDLDIQLGLGSTWKNGIFAGDILFGIVFPTSSLVSPCANYLTMPLGNNGHYELRGGGQFVYEFGDFVSLSANGSYTWGLPSIENIIPSFKGSKAFGLLPSCISAKIKWEELVINSDLMFYPKGSMGCKIGYQFFWKREDKFSSFLSSTNNGVSDIQLIDLEILQKFSKKKAHKAKFSLFNEINDFTQFSLGFEKVLAGKNIGTEFTLFGSLVITFD